MSILNNVKSVVEYRISIDSVLMLTIPSGSVGYELDQATQLFDLIARTSRPTGYMNLFAMYDLGEDRGVILKQYSWDRE